MTAPTRIEVVCASDAAYWPALATMIWSLRVNCDDAAAYRVWLFDGGLPADGVERLAAAVAPIDVRVIRPPTESIRGLLIGEHYSEVAYFRLLIPDLLPGDASRALYLDADTIVTAPLREPQRSSSRRGNIYDPSVFSSSARSLSVNHNRLRGHNESWPF